MRPVLTQKEHSAAVKHALQVGIQRQRQPLKIARLCFVIIFGFEERDAAADKDMRFISFMFHTGVRRNIGFLALENHRRIRNRAAALKLQDRARITRCCQRSLAPVRADEKRIRIKPFNA